MRLYHLLSAQYGLMALRHRRLRASRLTELNDPFELIGVDVSNADLRKAMHRYRNTLSETKGIHCFARRWSNPVLWSHYADKHRGICLGFDVSDRLATPVAYEPRRLHPGGLLSGSDTQRERFMLRVLATKFSHWRYEDEVRVFVGLQDRDEPSGSYFTDFSSEVALRQVIVGCECPLSRTDIQDALGDLAASVETFKARPAFRTFQVVRNRDEKLWR